MKTLRRRFFSTVYDSHEKRRRHHRQHLIKQQGPHCFLIASVTDLLSTVTHHGRTCPIAGSNPRKFQVPHGNTIARKGKLKNAFRIVQ